LKYNLFTVTFDQLNAYLLNKSIDLYICKHCTL